MVDIILKHWGNEVILHKDRYVMKILNVDPHKKLSLQYHEKKDETLYVSSGKGQILLEVFGKMEMIQFNEGDYFNIPIMTKHCIENNSDKQLILIEASSTELDDVIRLETYE